MADKRILASWIDDDDIRASLAEDNSKCRNLRLDFKMETLRDWQPLLGVPSLTKGLIRGFLDQIASPKGPRGNFVEIHLLSRFSDALNEHFKYWISDERVTIHPANLENPDDPTGIDPAMNFKSVFDVSRKLLEEVYRKDRDLCIYLSPGTRTAECVWIVLGRTTFPAMFFQYWGGFVFGTQIPFDIKVEMAPEVLRASDLRIAELGEGGFGRVQGFESILGESIALKHAVQRAQDVAIRDVSVLLSGESGTGKELFAQAIHRASHRGRSDPEFKKFVAVNCAGIPSELLESELFGHKKGSFTGAFADKIGAFETAHGGTLFLDEVGELAPQHQTKLLRAMQPIGGSPCLRKICPVGGKEKQVDVRIIAATNRNSFDDVNAGTFRDDLYYRLASVRIKLPPLRERRADIQLLVEGFLDILNEQFSDTEPLYHRKTLTPAALRMLRGHSWPGNIRELQGVLTQAAVFARSPEIGGPDIKNVLDSCAPVSDDTIFSRSRGEGFNLKKRIRDIKMAFIQDAMMEAEGKPTAAAKLLGISQQAVSQALKNAKVP